MVRENLLDGYKLFLNVNLIKNFCCETLDNGRAYRVCIKYDNDTKMFYFNTLIVANNVCDELYKEIEINTDKKFICITDIVNQTVSDYNKIVDDFESMSKNKDYVYYENK